LLEELVRRLGDQNGVSEDEAIQEEGVLVPLRVRLLGPVDRRVQIAKLSRNPEPSLDGRGDVAARRLGAVDTDERTSLQLTRVLLQRGDQPLGPLVGLSIAL
jgi:hypothetical protein